MDVARTHRLLSTRRLSTLVAITVGACVALSAAPAAPTPIPGAGVTQAAAATGKPVFLKPLRRKARRGGALAMRGRILAGDTAVNRARRRGSIRIQVRRGRRWVLSRRTRATASGFFRVCARVRVRKRQRFARLRALTPAGRSRVVWVRVKRRAPRRCGLYRKRAGNRVVLADNGSTWNPNPMWGKIDCQSDSRHRRIGNGGVGGSAFRRMTVYDGDDVWGERCELGLNDHRYSPTAIYKEGQRRLTHVSVRLPSNFPLYVNTWQAVLQMKQAQPSANGGGTPILELDAYGGRWRLRQSLSAGPAYDSRELWSAPADRGAWTRMTFNIRYSQHSGNGRLQLSIDVNGDGDYGDSGERSPNFTTYTLKRETSGGSSDGIAPGQSIPSHLRAGIYHNDSIGCGGGCSVDVDELRVVRP